MATSIGDVLSVVNSSVPQDGQALGREPWRHVAGVARSSLSVLRNDWPETYSALTSSYFDASTFGRSYLAAGVGRQAGQTVRHNDAGYLCRGLVVMLERACGLYAHLEPTRLQLDLAAAAEVRYQWTRQRRPRDVRPFLVTCWLNLLVERPERIWPERYGRQPRLLARPVCHSG